jgi:hypothetical protein
MLKGSWKDSGQFLKEKGKPLENAEKPTVSQKERRQIALRLLAKIAISIPFLRSTVFLLTFIKRHRSCGKLKNAQRFFSYFWSFQPYHF